MVKIFAYRNLWLDEIKHLVLALGDLLEAARPLDCALGAGCDVADLDEAVDVHEAVFLPPGNSLFASIFPTPFHLHKWCAQRRYQPVEEAQQQTKIKQHLAFLLQRWRFLSELHSIVMVRHYGNYKIDKKEVHQYCEEHGNQVKLLIFSRASFWSYWVVVEFLKTIWEWNWVCLLVATRITVLSFCCIVHGCESKCSHSDEASDGKHGEEHLSYDHCQVAALLRELCCVDGLDGNDEDH